MEGGGTRKSPEEVKERFQEGLGRRREKKFKVGR